MEITVWEWRTVMRYFKLPIENDKTLIEKKTDVAIYWELNINCWEWEIVAWEKEITMRDYRLLFLSRWTTASKRNISLKMAEQLSAEYFTKFVDSLKSTTERDFRLSRIVHVGLEILCQEALGIQNNAYRHITVSKFLFKPVWAVRIVFSRLIKKDFRYFKCIMPWSKGKNSIGILCKFKRETGVPYYKGNDRATAWD